MEAPSSVTAAVVVKRLSFGSTADERRQAATEVAGLARSDQRTKRLLPELGVVPPLVSMLADEQAGSVPRLAAAEGLHELATGTHRNKVHIVKAGLLNKLPRLLNNKDVSTSRQLALLLLSVSTLANTDFRLPTSDLLPFLVTTLSAADVPADTKLPCLLTLRNLSTKLEHVRDIVSSGAVRALLLALSLADRKKETPEAAAAALALSVLADLAATSAAGRKAVVEADETAPRALVGALTWSWHESATSCREDATYLVTVLAHGGGRALRRTMCELGAVQALLEVSLLGSPLARKRAARILQWFKNDDDGRQSRRMRAHSGSGQEAEDCRNAVDKIVKQSLDRNMKSILRRATARVDLMNVKQLLVTSSSSKSLSG